MKIKKILMCVCGALAFAACSTEEPVGNGNNTDVNLSDGYVSVSVAMPVATRADDDYEYGSEEESKVNNVLFFFFDANDVCIDIQRIESAQFSPVQNKEPYVENIGTAEIRLKTGLDYKKIAVVLNSSVEELSSLQNDILNLDDLLSRKDNYIEKNVKKENIGQPMSNSVYYEMENSAATPTSNKKVILVPINENNIYKAVDKTADGALPAGKSAVEVFVERIAARIDVEEAVFDMDSYYISKDDPDNKTIILYKDDLTTEEITIKPVVKGLTLNVLVNEANLIKNISSTLPWGYSIGNFGWSEFQWNDPRNKRCYWAITNDVDDVTYYSWNQATARGNIPIKAYVHPNTLRNTPILDDKGNYTNEKATKNLKVMVTAELHKYNDAGEDEGPVDIVRFGADYMLPQSLFAQTANNVNNAIRSIDWTAAGLTDAEGNALSADQVNAVAIAVYNAFVGKTNDNKYFGVDAGALSLKISNDVAAPQGEADAQAVIAAAEGFYTYDIDFSDVDIAAALEGLDQTELLEAVKAKIDETITATVADINGKNIIYYWKDGKTYYYISVRHQGFYGLLGNGPQNFLFGVVRNHIYKVKLNGIYGLGTPVIDPNKPINPDRPEDEDPSYLQAKINILAWRIVPVNVTIH